jgi:diaminopimelate epimerase
MHGLGNDMIVVNSLGRGWAPTAAAARYLCERRLGIGADQMLILLPSTAADFRMLTFNADGSEVEMCGNGIRCLARWLQARGITQKNPLALETRAGIIRPEVIGELVRVDMGEPEFDAERVPVQGAGRVQDVEMSVEGRAIRMSAVSMGNPHCVIRVPDAAQVPLSELGPKIENHPWFPRRTNVEFVEVVNRGRLRVRVWERGAGATLACGTGACAAAVVMIAQGFADRKVTVGLPGGDLEIEWDEKSNRVLMTGPATFVFEGVIEVPDSLGRK